MCGTQSTDANTGELPGALAEYLGVPGLTNAREITLDGGRVRVKRETDTGYQTLSAPTPALVSVTKSANEPRYPSLKGIMGAKKKTITIQSLAEAGVDVPVGQDGARTELTHTSTPPVRGKGEVFEAADAVAGIAKHTLEAPLTQGLPDKFADVHGCALPWPEPALRRSRARVAFRRTAPAAARRMPTP